MQIPNRLGQSMQIPNRLGQSVQVPNRLGQDDQRDKGSLLAHEIFSDPAGGIRRSYSNFILQQYQQVRCHGVMRDATDTPKIRRLVTQADVPLFRAHHAQTWGIRGPSYHCISLSCIIHIISCISFDIIMKLSKRERSKPKTLLALLNSPFPSALSWNPTWWINPLSIPPRSSVPVGRTVCKSNSIGQTIPQSCQIYTISDLPVCLCKLNMLTKPSIHFRVCHMAITFFPS